MSKKSPLTIGQVKAFIEEGNGSLSSFKLSTIIGRQHAHVMDKIEKNFGKSVVSEFESTETYNNNHTRKVYLLPESLAFGVAMSYDPNLGTLVYDGFKAYKKEAELLREGIVEVIHSSSHEEAVEAATQTLEKLMVTYLGEKHSRIAHRIEQFYQESTSPLEAMDRLNAVYKDMSPVFANDPEYRQRFLNTWKRTNSKLAEEYRTSKSRKDFSTSVYCQYDTVETDIQAKELRIERLGRTVAENKLIKYGLF